MHNVTMGRTDRQTDVLQYDANGRSYCVQQYLVDLVEYSNIVTELERRAEHDDEGRKHQVYVQTLQTSSPSSSLSSSSSSYRIMHSAVTVAYWVRRPRSGYGGPKFMALFSVAD